MSCPNPVQAPEHPGFRREPPGMGGRFTVAFILVALLCTCPAGATPAPDPGTPTLIQQGGRALAHQAWDEALAHFQQAADMEPDNPLPWLGLSEAHQGQGDLLKALELARKAQAVAPGHADSVRRVARLQIRVGAPAEALESLASLRRMRPDDVEAYVLAALVLRKIDRLDPAVELLRQGLNRGLASPEIFEQLAFLELSRGRITEARAVAEQGLQAFESHAPLAFALGLALAQDPAGRAAAIPELKRALELGITHPGRVHLELGSLLGELSESGCSREGLSHLQQARDALPDSADAHFRLGNAQRACGELEAAKESLLRFQELNRAAEQTDHGGRSVGASLNRAQGLASEGRLAAAVELLDELTQSTPEDDRVWTLKAKVLFSMGRRDGALDAAREASKHRPGRVEPHYLQGLFLSQMGRLQDARTALTKAAALDAERGDVQALLAAVLAELGEHDSAAGHFEQALVLNPADANLRLAYARLLKAMGRQEDSDRQMEVYRALGGG